MSYSQLIDLAIANEENRRDLEFPEPWDEPSLEAQIGTVEYNRFVRAAPYVPGVTDE